MTLIIFDVDGALVCSERKDSPCFVQTYEQLYGKPFPSLDWERFPHVTDTTIFAAVIEQHFSRQSQAAEIAAFQKHYLALLREKRWLDPAHSREAPGARAAMELLLADERYSVGVATGGWRRVATLKKPRRFFGVFRNIPLYLQRF
jgi:phosphoglycolate phosphatase-like HAD superfamily hydrolase